MAICKFQVLRNFLKNSLQNFRTRMISSVSTTRPTGKDHMRRDQGLRPGR